MSRDETTEFSDPTFHPESFLDIHITSPVTNRVPHTVNLENGFDQRPENAHPLAARIRLPTAHHQQGYASESGTKTCETCAIPV